MEALTIQEIKKLKNIELTDKIIEVKKALFELKFKQATQKSIKTHLLKKYKRMLAQLLTIERNLQGKK